MKTTKHSSLAKVFRASAFAFAVAAISMSVSPLVAATGDELLMSALPAASMNRGVIDGDTLVSAVSQAVSQNKRQAPEIVSAAIPKARTMATQKAIVRAAIVALGDYRSEPKGLIPQIVYAAIKSSPNCGSGDGKNGYGKDGARGCECAEQFTKTAIEALGADPSERLVTDITAAAIQATDGRCANDVVNAASGAAPQYASAIADAGARAGTGNGPDFSNGDGGITDPNEGIVFSPTGRPVPAPFVLPPSSNGGGVSGPTTSPVN